MTKFKNKSKSLLPRSAETIAHLWDKMVEESKAESERQGKPWRIPEKPNLGEKVNTHNFDKYMTLVTGYESCRICNGPRGLWGFPVELTCLRYPVHTVLLLSKVEEDLWESRLGKLCKHGLYLAECRECVEIACAENIERNAPLERSEV